MQPKRIYGGQAVIEGVMMKGPKFYTIATRSPKGEIKVKKTRFKSITEKHKWMKWPFLRGVVSLVETMMIGIKALNYSANETQEKEEDKMTTKEAVISIVISMLFAIGLFKFLPFFLAGLTSGNDKTFGFAVMEGIIKIIIFILYIWIISFMKDIHRVFQYHGAEHKTIHCFEAGKPLTAKNAKKFSLLHPRCGTTFIIIVIFISILIYLVIPPQWNFWYKFLARVFLLFPIASVSYEFLRFTGTRQDNPIIKALSWPGMQFQRLTTREPDLKQLDVAVESFKALMKAEGESVATK